jgi:DNA-binding transcriptional regulator LsrR (DeoR family)
MKKLIVSMFILLLLAGGSVNAQKRKPVKKADPISNVLKDRAKTQTDNIVAALALNQDQQDKVYAIVLESTIKKDSVIGKSAGKDATTLMESIRPINDARDTNIKSLLTPEQAIQYDAKKGDLTSIPLPLAPPVPPVK